ncbi:MAG: response regulator, partial [Spirulinaceae cyanobacterium RM2_2_10]|nr:response regulator [Spirulinaceae cyanobacterium RM2_2_10]
MKPQASKKPKILIVDDEPDNLDLLYRTFRRDYRVLRAESGPVALELLKQESHVAAIISDQRMPIMSGTEFLSLTAQQYPDIIRIILTGYTDVEDLVEAINSGKVFKYVTKPWEAEHLKEIVRQAIDTHNVLRIRTDELSRSLRRESLLNTVTNTIRNAQFGHAEGSPLLDVLQAIVNTVGRVIGVDYCLLQAHGDRAREYFIYRQGLTHPAVASLADDIEGDERASPNERALLAQTVWETAELEILPDVVASDRLQGSPERARAFGELGISTTVMVPLICQLERMATLALHRTDPDAIWDEDETQLAMMVADQAALAISQARAYEQVRGLAQREALVNSIVAAIRSSLDPQEIFMAIAQQLGTTLGVDGCALSLWTAADEYVQCVGLYDRRSASVDVVAESELPTPEAGGTVAGSLPRSLAPIRGNPVLCQVL